MKEENALVNDGPIPGESLTGKIRGLPFNRPAEFTNNKDITERLWSALSDEKHIRALNALLEIGIPLDQVAAQMANGLFREGKISAQNAVMILPSLTIMVVRIAESMGTKYRLSSDDKHTGVSDAEIVAAMRKAKQGSNEMNNKAMKGFKAVNQSKEEFTNKADNVGFLQNIKERG